MHPLDNSFQPELGLEAFSQEVEGLLIPASQEAAYWEPNQSCHTSFPVSTKASGSIQLLSLVLFSKAVNVTSFYSSSQISFTNSEKSGSPSGLL